MRLGLKRLFAMGALLIAAGAAFAGAEPLSLDDEQIAKIVRHGPWPPPEQSDYSNRVSGKPAAIAFGQLLFFDKRLSRDGTIACASCHDPARGWADGKPRAGGLARLDRNTQSLFNVRYNRWFGWDGRTDSLWRTVSGRSLRKLRWA